MARSFIIASPKRPTARSSTGELFLVDSGAQYEDGTTDITRTVAVGEPTKEMRDRFTRVLKGHIAIARAVFPDGTTGAQLDSFARAPLWSAGLDFDHGTGHGVGSYLSVHEGPARISKLGTAVLKRGMILSNEPGYYKAGSYGIRIENLVLVDRSAKRRRRRTPAQRVRNADAGADRPQPNHGDNARSRRNRMARQLSCTGAFVARAAGRRQDTSLARNGHPPVGGRLTAAIVDQTTPQQHARLARRRQNAVAAACAC